MLVKLYKDDIERKFPRWNKNQKLKGTDHPSEELSVCLWGVKQCCLLLQCELVVSQHQNIQKVFTKFQNEN